MNLTKNNVLMAILAICLTLLILDWLEVVSIDQILNATLNFFGFITLDELKLILFFGVFPILVSQSLIILHLIHTSSNTAPAHTSPETNSEAIVESYTTNQPNVKVDDKGRVACPECGSFTKHHKGCSKPSKPPISKNSVQVSSKPVETKQKEKQEEKSEESLLVGILQSIKEGKQNEKIS